MPLVAWICICVLYLTVWYSDMCTATYTASCVCMLTHTHTHTHTKAVCFMFLWPCIVSKAWKKNTNNLQQYRWFIINSRCWLLTTVSTCFGHLYAHHQEKRPRVTAYGVYLLVVLDVAGCGTVVLHYQQIYPICSNTWSFLLMMGIKMPETCRDCSQ